MRATRFLLVALAGCSTSGQPADAGADLADAAANCPALSQAVTTPGDPIDGHTWASFARPFFATWCTRCHSQSLTPTDAGDPRNGAPVGLDWDVEASVRLHLADIRHDVGVSHYMPFNDPKPTCAERFELVRWIDAGAP
jgi:uncharacterized membrane protein